MIRKAVWQLCCVAWETERVPTDWMQGVVFPLYKDGDDRDPMNYRGITLLSVVGKVYNRVLGDRLISFAERETGRARRIPPRPRNGRPALRAHRSAQIAYRAHHSPPSSMSRKRSTRCGGLACGTSVGRRCERKDVESDQRNVQRCTELGACWRRENGDV